MLRVSRKLGSLPLLVILGVALAPMPAAAQQVRPLPALRFHADALSESFFEQLSAAPQFQKLSREAYGSPLELRVYHTWRINRGSAEATGLLAAVTLGILPQVSSGDHTIVYEVLANGVLVASFKYSKALTHARSLWTEDKSFGMGKDGVEWAHSTVALFLRDAATDAKLAVVSEEFDYYFGTPPVTPAAAPGTATPAP
jgi:hypothetical protein